MAEYKEGRWARELLARQSEDGLWTNYFHTLSFPVTSKEMTTEQSLRRLYHLGFTLEDEVIARTVAVLDAALAGDRQLPDRREKVIDWDVFTDLMLATWVRVFTQKSERANAVALTWARILDAGYASGAFSEPDYRAAYTAVFGQPPKGARFIDPFSFYTVSLPSGLLSDDTRRAALRHLLARPGGIYYVAGGPLSQTPDFASKAAVRYLNAIELLAPYVDKNSDHDLLFVRDWLNENRLPDGRWDMGPAARDNVSFPLSDSWRQKNARIDDCTHRISRLYERL